MRYDIVIVTYNSQQWLQECVKALAAVHRPLDTLHLIFVDNGSADGTVACLEELKHTDFGFGGFTVICNTQKTGYSAACNQGAAAGSAPLVFFLRADAKVDPNIFVALDAVIAEASASMAAFACRQLPYETGYPMDPVTLKMRLVSSDALVVRRSVWEELGGLDERFSSYGADRDFSWRVHAKGYEMCYVPQAEVARNAVDPTDTVNSYAERLYDELMLRYKFGSVKEIWQGEKQYLTALRHPQHFDGVRRVLAKNYLRHGVKVWSLLGWRFGHQAESKALMAQFDQNAFPDRGVCACYKPTQTPLVSVIVRTCGRPDTLRHTLESLRHQTYRNFEVLVAEDGKPTAKEMLMQEFSDLNIQYLNDGVRYGRAENGNRALAAAKGELCNFLDDDDFFYPDHLELLVSVWSAHPQADIVLGSAMAMFVTKDGKVTKLEPMVFDRIDRFTMCQDCRIPIQTVLFRRSLFAQYGGMPPQLGAHEDWAMWLKYLEHAKRITPHKPDVCRTTSIFVQPAEEEAAAARIAAYSESDAAFYGDESLHFDVTLADMRRYYDNMIRDMRCLESRGELHDFLEKQARRFE